MRQIASKDEKKNKMGEKIGKKQPLTHYGVEIRRSRRENRERTGAAVFPRARHSQ